MTLAVKKMSRGFLLRTYIRRMFLFRGEVEHREGRRKLIEDLNVVAKSEQAGKSDDDRTTTVRVLVRVQSRLARWKPFKYHVC